MSKYRQAARIDENQPGIVEDLRGIHGLSVEVEHDDILVGWQGKTYWYEIKDPNKALKKDGTYLKGAIKDSQIKLDNEWTGHYKIVCSTDEILKDLGIIK